MRKLFSRDLFDRPVFSTIIILSVIFAVILMYCVMSYSQVIVGIEQGYSRAFGGDYELTLSAKSLSNGALVTTAPLKTVVDDGKLSVVVVNQFSKWIYPVMLIKFLRGKILDSKYTEEYEVSEVKIEALDDITKIELDGEIIDDQVLNCRVVSNTLKIFG